MPIDDNVIVTPVSISDVQLILGSSSNDLGTLCTHANINMWAKWKPVPLRNIVGLPDEIVNGNSWKGNPVEGTNRPWWYGGGQGVGSDYYTYGVPVISDLSDIGSNGEQNDDSVWTYRKPSGGMSEPYRLADFVGYYHDARQPVWSDLPKQLYLNFTNTIGIGVLDYPETGEFSLSDVRDMLGIADGIKLYAAMVIVVHGSSASTNAFVNKRELSPDDNETWQFKVEPNSNGTGLVVDDGRSITVSTSNTVDVYLFLTTSANETNVDNMTKYSVRLSSKDVAYKQYKPTYIVVSLDAWYKFTTINLTGSEGIKGYFEDTNDGSIWYFDGLIQSINTTVSVKGEAYLGSSVYGTLYISLYITGKVAGTAKSFTLNAYTERRTLTTTYYSRNMSLNDAPLLTYYGSMSDLQSGKNPKTAYGWPLPRRCDYNGSDADVVGNFTDGKITIRPMFNPDIQHATYIFTKESGTDLNYEDIIL